MAFLEAALPASVLARAKDIFASRRRDVLLGGGALAVAAIAVAMLWSGNDFGYGVLFSGLAPDEGGRAVDELQKLNEPYRVAGGGREILVPNADLGRTRLVLAARGVPKKSNDSWSLFDNELLGVSPFAEQAHYMRGLEESLAKNVGAINGIASAKVTLAVPQRTPFLDTQPKPSASVMVQLEPGVTLSRPQLDGIVHLVSSGVPGLEPAQVSVVDETGSILTRDRDNQSATEIPEQLALVHDIDQRYQTRIEGLLAPAVGKDNLRVIVDADVNFSQAKRSSVTYGQSHALSQDQSTREHAGGDAAPSGVPGALSNQPPATPNVPITVNNNATDPNAHPAPPTAKENHDIVNYDIDQTVEQTQDMPWHINAISASVLINNPTGAALPDEKIQSIKALVQSAIGSGAKRDVTVIDLPFEGNGAASTAHEWWRQVWARDIAKNALLALAGLLTLFGAVLPALRWLRQRSAQGVAANQVKLVAEPVAADADRTQAQSAVASSAANVTVSVTGPHIVEPDINAVRKIVANDPGGTAHVIKEWLAHAGRTKQSD